MYEELVNQLRNPWQYNGLIAELTDSAAEAIEELKLVAESNRRNAARWAETAEAAVEQLPRWIPTTERLPNNKREVQITVFWHDEWRTMYGYYDGAHWNLYIPMHTTDMPIDYDRCMIIFPDGREPTKMDRDDFFATYPEVVEVTDAYVIGWMEKPMPMPLPEPRKEEDNG